MTTLEDYLNTYGNLLAQQARHRLNPLHTPGVDEIHPTLEDLKRPPFDAQAHLITAGVKTLRRQKSLFVVAEMGTGKTLLGMSIAHCHAKGPYRALIMCPGQLTKKWEREILQTLPEATVRHIESWQDVTRLVNSGTPARPEWFILARDRAKLGYKRSDGFSNRLLPTVDGAGKKIRVPAAACPRCGNSCINKDGQLITPSANKQTRCEAIFRRPDGKGVPCNEPLWQASREMRRMEPAKLIHRKLKGFFDYLILDEVHEEKSAESAQANAAGALIASARKVIALTGTLIGGYAEHLRPLLFRLAPSTLVKEGLTWSKATAFVERYGRLETIVKEKGETGKSNVMSRGSSKSVTKVCRPGIMPTLFGRHLIGNAIFLSLDEVSDGLAPLEEQVFPVDMDPDLEKAYAAIEKPLSAAIKEMAARGDRRLLGAMLQALLTYPDHPQGWEPVGYYEGKATGAGTFVKVVQPPSLNSQVRAKEKKLLDLVRHEWALGRQCWVYVTSNGKHDVQSRLEGLLREEGLKTLVLTSDVPLARREEWIDKEGAKADVVLSHPKLVETGLDLFSKKPLGHNFSTLIFYQTGYNLFTLRQASRRAWRIGQSKGCKVFYLYYAGTMQERAMSLMGKKLTAAQALEGKFSAEGLAAMAGDDNIEIALAKSLAERMDEDAARTWRKVESRDEGANSQDFGRELQADFDEEIDLMALFENARA